MCVCVCVCVCMCMYLCACLPVRMMPPWMHEYLSTGLNLMNGGASLNIYGNFYPNANQIDGTKACYVPSV